MNPLANYEEGHLWVPVREHWWQVWLPTHVLVGTYFTVGERTTMTAFGRNWLEIK